MALTKQFSGIHTEPFYTQHYLPRFELNKRFDDGKTDLVIPDFILENNLREDYDIKLKYNTYKYDSFFELCI